MFVKSVRVTEGTMHLVVGKGLILRPSFSGDERGGLQLCAHALKYSTGVGRAVLPNIRFEWQTV
jgi:hypothetical protein